MDLDTEELSEARIVRHINHVCDSVQILKQSKYMTVNFPFKIFSLF